MALLFLSIQLAGKSTAGIAVRNPKPQIAMHTKEKPLSPIWESGQRWRRREYLDRTTREVKNTRRITTFSIVVHPYRKSKGSLIGQSFGLSDRSLLGGTVTASLLVCQLTSQTESVQAERSRRIVQDSAEPHEANCKENACGFDPQARCLIG